MCDNFFDIRTLRRRALHRHQRRSGARPGADSRSAARSSRSCRWRCPSPAWRRPTRARKRNVARAVTTEKRGDNRTMGRKHIVPYGLYRAHGFVSAPLASHPVKGTGLLRRKIWTYCSRRLTNMFEHDRSAARGEMATRKLRGLPPRLARSAMRTAHELFDAGQELGASTRASVMRSATKPPIIGRPPAPSRDYAITVDSDAVPEGVEIIER